MVAALDASRTPEPQITRPRLASSPKHARAWARESLHTLEWPTGSRLAGQVALVEESFDHGGTWSEIAKVGEGEGRFSWTVPKGGEAGRDIVRLRVRVPMKADAKADASSGASAPRESTLVATDDVTLVPSEKRAYTWKLVQPNAPWGPRDGAGGIVHDGKMWLIGGWNGGRWPAATANDVWSSPDGVAWSLVKPNTYRGFAVDPKAKAGSRAPNDWDGRHFAGYASHAGRMWIVGGDPVSGFYQTDVWTSANGRDWSRVDVHTTTPRTYVDTNAASATFGKVIPWDGFPPVEEAQFGLRTFHMTGIFEGKLWLMGGQRVEGLVNPEWPGAKAKAFDDVFCSTDGATWTRVETEGPRWSPRGLVSAVVEHRGRMWVIGGGLHDDAIGGRPDREYQNDVWSSRDGRHWERLSEHAPFTPRIWHDVAVFDGMLWVLNGYDGHDNRSDVYYSPDGDNWYDASPPQSFVPRHAGTVWAHRDALYVGAGNAIDAKWHADVWKLTREDAR